MPRSRRRGVAVGLLLAGLLAALLAGCGGRTPSAVPTVTGSAPALWNPCDALDAGEVGRLFATTMSVEVGTPTQPLCRFTPERTGDPVVDATYSLYPAGLADALSTFPQATKDATITTPRVPGADDARLVVSRSAGTLLVTGFVQNGDLIQLVNAVDPAPHPRTGLATGVRRLMTQLSRHAAESGLTTPTATPTPTAPRTPPTTPTTPRTPPPTTPAGP